MRTSRVTAAALPLALLLAVELATASGFASATAAPETTRVLSWGDQRDGTYKNPVLKADYSAPDVIRVGNDFYLIASWTTSAIATGPQAPGSRSLRQRGRLGLDVPGPLPRLESALASDQGKDDPLKLDHQPNLLG